MKWKLHFAAPIIAASAIFIKDIDSLNNSGINAEITIYLVNVVAICIPYCIVFILCNFLKTKDEICLSLLVGVHLSLLFTLYLAMTAESQGGKAWVIYYPMAIISCLLILLLAYIDKRSRRRA